ncbi:MAG TPA: type II toxin-antitoxin system VapC family toxin [Candidatus Baltobacteraceae bacterium]|nr:type II toxin-antitoxin system VapC family toxin [Candidatus Baltobacteraceae bacterium]
MVIDTSALLAILGDEPERAQFAEAIEADPRRLVSAVTVVEASLVLESRYGSDAVDDLDLLLTKIDARIVSFGPSDVSATRAAYQRFGKGRHAAALNFGDCFSYALSMETGEALLFKGADFSQTDLRRVL